MAAKMNTGDETKGLLTESNWLKDNIDAKVTLKF